MSGTIKYRLIREVGWSLSPSGTLKYLQDLESEGFRPPKLLEKKREEKRERGRGRRSKPLAPWVTPTVPQAGRRLTGIGPGRAEEREERLLTRATRR